MKPVHMLAAHWRTPKGVEVETACGLTIAGKQYRGLDVTAWSSEVTCEDCRNGRKP